MHENPYAMANPWAMPWQPKYRGRVGDPRRLPRGHLPGADEERHLRPQHHRLPADRPSRQALQDLSSLVNLRIDNNDYSEVPAGQTWISNAWSGDMAAAASYMPKGVNVDVVGYWFPPRRPRPGRTTTRTWCCGRRPTRCSRHLFLNYLLDLPNVLENI